jgi:hypothetical protein
MFQPQVIRVLIGDEPAIEKHNELRLYKSRAPKIRPAEGFIDDR